MLVLSMTLTILWPCHLLFFVHGPFLFMFCPAYAKCIVGDVAYVVYRYIR